MRTKKFRVYKLFATMGIAVLVMLLLALPMSLALAQGAGAEKSIQSTFQQTRRGTITVVEEQPGNA